MPIYVDNGQERIISSARASRDTNLFRGFWQGSIPAATTYNFVLDIPAGVDLFGFTRISTAATVSVFVQFMSCTGFVSAEGPIVGKSLDRRDGKRRDSKAAIHRASSVSGAVQLDPEVELYVATAGPVRAPSGQTETGAQPAFDSSELPIFRAENKSIDTAANFTLYLFWQELASKVSR